MEAIKYKRGVKREIKENKGTEERGKRRESKRVEAGQRRDYGNMRREEV